MTAVLWLRRELRIHDHPALRAAIDRGGAVVPVFCFDDALLKGRHASGSRTQFLRECIGDLDRSLRDRGSRLIVARGSPPQELARLARELGATSAPDRPRLPGADRRPRAGPSRGARALPRPSPAPGRQSISDET